MIITALAMLQQTSQLPPFPAVPAKAPIGSVKLLDPASFPEQKMDFPIAAGPFQPTWASIEKNYPGSPAWLRETKFGIWVHFVPQSSGESGDWYARHLYQQGSLANRNHIARWGHPSEQGYKEVLRDWNPNKLKPADLVKVYKDAGARFLMIQGVHHDQFDLWNSRYQPWNATRLGPKRDLLREWVTAVKKAKMRYGVTFHHEYSWWWWQSAFGADSTGPLAGVPYDGNLTLEDGKGKWWEGLDPRLLYGIDLREYENTAEVAKSGWSPPHAGIFGRHLDYCRWYATWWGMRMIDVIDHYDPDFIYTDGTGQQPFEGWNTGTGYKSDAMQRVMAHFYNRTLERRKKVDTFSIVKFRKPTNGAVNTEEFGIPAKINTSQPWIAESPVGDWFYAPNFTYDSGMMIRYIIEAAARDGNACINVSLRPDGSLDEGSLKMLKEVGVWMRRNGAGIYGSHSWQKLGEGEVINGELKRLPGGALGKRQAEFKFNESDLRFTVGKDGALYVYCLTVPEPGSELVIRSFASAEGLLDKPVRGVRLLGSRSKVNWQQASDGLHVTMPKVTGLATAVGFKVEL